MVKKSEGNLDQKVGEVLHRLDKLEGLHGEIRGVK